LKNPKTNDKNGCWMLWFSMLSPSCSRNKSYLSINSAIEGRRRGKQFQAYHRPWPSLRDAYFQGYRFHSFNSTL